MTLTFRKSAFSPQAYELFLSGFLLDFGESSRPIRRIIKDTANSEIKAEVKVSRI